MKCVVGSRVNGSGEIDYYSSTTDLWTSGTMDPYFSYTLHYITPSWELRSYCLQTHYMPEDHTGENLQDALLNTLEEWKVDASKQVAITTDSCANIKLACRLLKWRRLSCFGHNLNLDVETSLNDTRIQRVLHVCRQIVAAFSRSSEKRDLVIAREQKNLPTHKLIADVSTRWGSTFDMVGRIMEQQEAIRLVLAVDRKGCQHGKTVMS